MTLRRSFAWSFTEQFGQRVLQFAGSVAIARLLTPDEVGVFALAMAVNALLASVREFGLGAYLVREAELTDDKIRTAFGLWLALAWPTAALLAALAPWIAGLYSTPGIAEVLWVVALNFVLMPFGQPAQALLQREMRFDLLNHVTLTSVAVKIAASVGFALLGWSYMALAWGMLLGSAVRVGLLLALRPGHLRLWPSLRHWRAVMTFGGWLTGAQLAGTITMEGQKFVLGGFLAPAAVALYERANQLPAIARQSLFQPIGRVLFPSFSEDLREGRPIGAKVEMLVAATAVMLWPAFAVLALLAEPVVVTLFGAPWRPAGEILPWLLLGQGLLTLLPQPEQILTPHGRVRRLFALRAFAAVNSLSFSAAGALHSLALFAQLRPAATTIFITVTFLALRGLIQARPARLLRHHGMALVVTLATAAPALLVRIQYGTEVPPAVLAAAFAVAPLPWLLALWGLGHPLSAEIGRLLRGAGGRARGLLGGGVSR